MLSIKYWSAYDYIDIVPVHFLGIRRVEMGNSLNIYF